MTILWGDTGKVLYGSLKTLSTTPYVNEQNVTSTPLYVGSSSTLPGGISPIVTFTLNTATMAPTFSGLKVNSYKSVFGMHVSGQNISGASQTVYYQINKNGTSYKTGNKSIPTGNYFTVGICDGSFNNGDVVDFYIWTPASSGVNYMYQNIFCIPSSVDVGAKIMFNASFNYTSLSSGYLPLTGKVNSAFAGSVFIYPANGTKNSSTIDGNSNNPIIYPVLSSHATFKLFQLQTETSGNAITQINNSATNYPQSVQNNFISSLSYRDLLR